MWRSTWRLRKNLDKSLTPFLSLVDPQSLQILEQNYGYDLLNPQKLLDKCAGKEVKLYYRNPCTDKEEIATASEGAG